MTLKELKENGTLKFLVDVGMINKKKLDYYNYVITFKEHRETLGLGYYPSVYAAADTHNVSVETIKRALRLLGKGFLRVEKLTPKPIDN